MSPLTKDFEYDEDGLPIERYTFRDMLDSIMKTYVKFHYPNDPEFTPEGYIQRQHIMLFDLSEAIGEVLCTLGVATDEDLAVYLRSSVSTALNCAKRQVEHGDIDAVADYVMNHLHDVKH